jgi:hypothetical protein
MVRVTSVYVISVLVVLALLSASLGGGFFDGI